MSSRHGAVDLDFGGAERTFRLGMTHIEELEEKVGSGIFQIYEAMHARTCRSKTISEALRIGLIGGGTAPGDALALVRRYCDERPLAENLIVALAVVTAGLARVNGTVAEKPAGEPVAAETGEPTSPPSTQPVS